MTRFSLSVRGFSSCCRAQSRRDENFFGISRYAPLELMKERERAWIWLECKAGFLTSVTWLSVQPPTLRVVCVCHLSLPCWLGSQHEGLGMSLRAQGVDTARTAWKGTTPQKFKLPLLPKSREAWTWGSDADNTSSFLSLELS